MADAAEVLPLPDEEPVDETPKSDDSSAADDSGEDKGKDVSFGTFLTVGPKQFRNVTVVGYDGLRDSVRAVRRSGDTVENIQIPYQEYKTLIEAQRQSDLASGRKPKRNLSKAVRGFFGKSVALDGKAAQVIGYDAQSDEVLINDESGRRWMKSGEMLRSSQNLSDGSATPTPTRSSSRAKSRDLRAVPTPTETTSSEATTRVVQDEGVDIDPDKTAQIQRAFEEGRVVVQDPAGQRTVGLSVDTSGKVLRQIETSSTSIQPSRINYVSSGGETVELTDVDVAISEITVPLNIETRVNVQTTATATPANSIRATREALQQARSAAATAVPVQNTAAVVAAVSAIIPASNTGALAAVAAAQNVLAAYDKSSGVRQNQIQQVTNQISDVANRINDLQQRSRQSLAIGNGGQAAQFERQIMQAQAERASLLGQQTDLQVTAINESNKASKVVEAVQQITPDKNGVVPDEQVAAVERLLPSIIPTVTAVPFAVQGASVAAAALPTPPKVAIPRTFAAGIPTRSTRATPNPSVRTPRPIRPLASGGLSTTSGQAQRAVDLNAAQQYDRADENGFTGAGLEESMAQEGGLPAFSGPLDIAQPQTQTYAAGAGDEIAEPADIFGAREEAGRARMTGINQSLAGAGAAGVGTPSGGSDTETESITIPGQAPRGPAGPTQEELNRQAAYQAAVAASALEQDQLQQQEEQVGAGAVVAGQSKDKQIESARKTVSNLIDAFDAIHGIGDVVGLLATFAHINLRLVATYPFQRDLPFTPKAGFPYECGSFGCLDLFACLAMLSYIVLPIIILAAAVTVLGGAAFGIADLVGAI